MNAHFRLLLCYATLLFILVAPSASRTVSFPATDANLVFWPDASWSASTGFLRSTNSSGASLTFAFAGQQVIVLGSSTVGYRVTLDGTEVYEFSSAESGRLFRASNLDEAAFHSITITREGSEAEEMSVSQVKIAYESSSGLLPSLVSSNATTTQRVANSDLPTVLATAPGSSSMAATTTASAFLSSRLIAESLSTFVTSHRRPVSSTITISTPSSTFSASPSRSSTMAAASMSPEADTSSSSAANAGVVAGAVVASLAGVALLILLALFFRKRSNRQTGDYYNADTGRQRDSGPFSGPSLITTGVGNDGGIGGSPRVPALESVGTDAEGWAARVARNNSWRRKAERLPETRNFYGVTSEVPLPSAPPPAVPPPRLSNSAVLMMADTHAPTAGKPSLPRKLPARYSPPPMVEPPSAVPISRPTRAPSQAQRFHIPTASRLPSAGFAPAPLRFDSADASRPQPPSPDSAPITSERLEEVGKDYQVVGGEEDRPHYFQTREHLPKYPQANGDPRR